MKNNITQINMNTREEIDFDNISETVTVMNNLRLYNRQYKNLDKIKNLEYLHCTLKDVSQWNTFILNNKNLVYLDVTIIEFEDTTELVFPDNLRHLRLTSPKFYGFKPLSSLFKFVQWPSNLKHLEIEFTDNIQYAPESLETLVLIGDRPVQPQFRFPESLKNIYIINELYTVNFNRLPLLWPPNIEHLYIGLPTSVNLDNIPDNIKTIELCGCNNKISKWPKNLKTLILGNFVSEKYLPSEWPESLEILDVHDGDLFIENLPKTLKRLTVPKIFRWKYYLEMNLDNNILHYK